MAPPGVADGDNPQRMQTSGGEFSKPMYQSVIKKEGATMMGTGLRAADAASLAEDYVTPPPKYKSSLLHRYLNDSLRHVMVANGVMDARKRNHSGSFSSNEYDDDLLSPSSSETEANFVYRAGKSPYIPSHILSSRFSRLLLLSSFFSLSVPICTFCFNSRPSAPSGPFVVRKAFLGAVTMFHCCSTPCCPVSTAWFWFWFSVLPVLTLSFHFRCVKVNMILVATEMDLLGTGALN